MRSRIFVLLLILVTVFSVSVAKAQVTFKKSKYRDLPPEWDVVAVIQTFAKCAAFRDVFYTSGSGNSYLKAAVNLSVHEEVRNEFETGLWVNALYQQYRMEYVDFKDTNDDRQVRYAMIKEKKPCVKVDLLRDHYD